MIIRDFLFNLDDRVKVWMAMSAGAVAIYCVDWRIQAAVLIVCLGLCMVSGARRFVMIFLVIVLILAVYTGISIKLTSGDLKITGMGFYFILLKFGPMFAMMVFIQASLNTSRFLHLLEGMRVPSKYVIPLGVCLRFIPSVVAETRQIRYAMRMRGIVFFSLRTMRHPFETLGYLMAPVLVRSLTIGEELARAAVARGIEAPGPKTSIHLLSFRTVDCVIFFAWSLIMSALIIMDHHLYAESLNAVQAALSGRPVC
jgi:energy-coupling factor transport system permease protein